MKFDKLAISAVILLILGALLYFGPALIPANPAPSNETLVINPGANYTNTPLKVYVLTSQNCRAFCDTAQILTDLEKKIGKLDTQVIDVTDEKSIPLVVNYTLQVLPTYFIDARSLVANRNSRALKDVVKKVNDNYYILDTIETKSGYIFGRVESKEKTLDYFTSPYTLEAVNFYAENYPTIKNFSSYFNTTYHLVSTIINQTIYPIETEYPFSLNESRRDACVQKLYPKWALDYHNCRNNYIKKCFDNPDAFMSICGTSWTPCAEAYGTFNVTDIRTCSQTNADPILLDMHKKASNRLLTAIPTLIANDKYILVGMYNHTYVKEQLCKLEPNAPPCKN